MTRHSFSSEIYDGGVVRASAAAFANVADVSVIEEPGTFVCCFENCRVDEDRVVSEFENYLINAMVSHAG